MSEIFPPLLSNEFIVAFYLPVYNFGIIELRISLFVEGFLFVCLSKFIGLALRTVIIFGQLIHHKQSTLRGKTFLRYTDILAADNLRGKSRKENLYKFNFITPKKVKII